MFVRNTALGTRLLLLMFLSVLLMMLDHQQRHLETIRKVLSLAVFPVQYTLTLPESFYLRLTHFFESQSQLQAENNVLQNKQLLLNLQLQRFEALEKENVRLKALLKSSARAGDKVLVAKLLQVDPDPFSHRVVLDKGSEQGVYEGQPVLDAYGVMGQVVTVGPISSVALLITDISHAIPVQSNRSGVRGIVVGIGSLSVIEMSHVTNTTDLQVGDTLVTSGLGERFPEGYPVGQIIEMLHDAGEPFIRVKVQPSAHMDRSREVLLIWPEGKGKHPLEDLFIQNTPPEMQDEHAIERDE